MVLLFVVALDMFSFSNESLIVINLLKRLLLLSFDLADAPITK